MTFQTNLSKYTIILASNSPRRHFLLNEIGLSFKIMKPENVDESFPIELTHEQVPIYLSKIKAESLKSKLKEADILITADTIVWLNNEVINKPENRDEAILMLKKLSGNTHQVYSGVCITSVKKQYAFSSKTDVKFKILSDDEITFYVDKYKPYDKAGAYGIQEWIGYIGIEHINGSYFNVMGLPIQKLYNELNNFIK
ncbi:MAG TPA: septum formation protein Maf [Bacteroidales bacterium]|nr:MAG: septum formation protein Maf [Bacteroidetes bacterium GWF2_33_38]OFY90424.1 MAG: septum formation protein Maf [Bacteroidetes bacterium RIFOXYA2_FULL_33_7]HBF89039.1 septum formation protein Maf [Bacteroidales bacterium]